MRSLLAVAALGSALLTAPAWGQRRGGKFWWARRHRVSRSWQRHAWSIGWRSRSGDRSAPCGRWQSASWVSPRVRPSSPFPLVVVLGFPLVGVLGLPFGLGLGLGISLGLR